MFCILFQLCTSNIKSEVIASSKGEGPYEVSWVSSNPEHPWIAIEDDSSKGPGNSKKQYFLSCKIVTIFFFAKNCEQ